MTSCDIVVACVPSQAHKNKPRKETFLLNWTVVDATHFLFWVASCQTGTHAEDYSYSFEVVTRKHIFKGTRNCAPVDISAAKMRELKRGFLLERAMCQEASQANWLSYRVAVRKN